MHYSLTFRVTFSFVAFTILIILIGSFYYVNSLEFIKSIKEEDQIQAKIHQFDLIYSLLKDAEASQRGYLLTGRKIYLQPYRIAKTKLDSNLIQLSKNMGSYNPKDFQMLLLKKATIFTKMDSTISLFEISKDKEALDLVNSSSGKKLMEDISRIINILIHKEKSQLIINEERVERNTMKTLVGLVCAVASVVLLIFYALYKILIEIKKNTTLRMELRVKNLELIEANGENIALNKELIVANKELSYSNDELNISNEELKNTNNTISKVNLNLNQKTIELEQYKMLLEERVRDRTLELEKSKAELTLITNAIPALIGCVDKEERYVFVNKRYESIFQIPQSEIIGMKMEELLDVKIYTSIKPFVNKALAGENINFINPVMLPNSEMQFVSVNYIPRFEKNKVVGFYILILDITKLKNAEIEIEQAYKEMQIRNKELIRMNDVLDNFVQMAAHDLRAPVTNLEQMVKMLKENDSSSISSHEVIAAMGISVSRLIGVITGMIEVVEVQSKAESGHELLHFKSLIESIILELNLDSVIDFNLNYDFQDCPSIHYIPAYLRSIVVNLISNAVKYRIHNQPLEIKLTAKNENEFIVLSISDNGIGMDLKRYGKNLFKPFTRFTKQADGKGIGLHLVRNMIERNGGRIEVESKLNEGTIMKCFLKEYES